ncbi:mono/diheme cytochrome c family protein [Chelatococcus caeni]|uniref:Mono/diheme cytochrome c family protein n=1 Tax=Chelatococcus caeni TaxID=1348468 RepID=A0A840BWN3_9HYPH|nr:MULTISPECIES: cytochrome c [Chelatococcus]MBB4015878.1 mono/diheme cytochrome c family protein [Chelatococcus caeni]
MSRILLVFLAASGIAQALPALAEDAEVARGKYLVTIGGCNDCHTPGYLFGSPDMSRFLGGSDVGFEIPGEGVFVGRNITPDNETGIGSWTKEQIVTAIQTGERPDGRILAPIMPWHAFANLTPDDAMAIAAYLKSLPPVSHEVPGPFGPGEKVTTFTFRILPPGETAAAAPGK